MRFQIFLIFFLSFSFTLISCKEEKAITETPELSMEEDIRVTDSLFSDMSATQGMKAAFLFYMDDDAIIIRPNTNPITGADAVAFLSDLNDTDFKMIWKADQTLLSSSNDLGYAYGNYSIKTTKIDSVLKGSYVHIWKKLEDGSWKFVLNSWNEAEAE